MPTQADDEYCVYRDDTGEKRFPITGTEDAATFRRWQGEITTDPGLPSPPDPPGPSRISALIMREQLSGADWAEHVAESRLPMRVFGGLFLSFPLCEVRRRFPDAPLVAALDRLDPDFISEFGAMVKRDSQLGDRVRQLVIRGSSTAAAAIAWSGGAADQPVGEDLFEFAQRPADDVVAMNGDCDLAKAIGSALRAAEPLRGVALSEALSAVAHTTQSSSAS
jgi:hypothetical protein